MRFPPVHQIYRCLAGRRRGLWHLALATACHCAGSSVVQAEAPQIVRWEIEATVIKIADPDNVFSSVRLGDPVRGTLTYDVNNFTYPAWLGLASMTIDNPRTGEPLRFEKDVAGSWADVFWYDDFPHDTREDDLEIYQSVVPPAGFVGEAPIVTAFFRGPSSVLSGENPLIDLDLDDWPIALLSFYDVYEGFEITTYIDAETFSMTRIESPVMAADFDYDGDVDAVDRFGWAQSFGLAPQLGYADADGDSDADGADFLIWQRQISGPAQQLSGAVPEPSTLVLAWAAVLAIDARRLLRGSSH
jgi:hypothetical protein